MEAQPTLTELERKLIEIVRALPEEQARQLLEHALLLKQSELPQDAREIRELREQYVPTPHLPVVSEEEFKPSLNRSLKENANVWAELAKR